MWDGKTERRINPTDHDKLTRLIFLAENQTTSIAEIKKEQKDHNIRDDERFAKVNWFIAIGIGIMSTLQILIRR